MDDKRNRPLYILYDMVSTAYVKELENFHTKEEKGGICFIIDNLYYKHEKISRKEQLKLRSHFKKMKPTPFVNKQFYYMEQSVPKNEAFYFVEKNYQIRLKFLNYLIQLTKPWYIKWLER